MRGTSPERTRRCLGRGCAGEFEEGLEHLHGVAGAALLSCRTKLDAGAATAALTRSASWPTMQ
jgi:hypothetical protein